jgi:hypothetical protein
MNVSQCPDFVPLVNGGDYVGKHCCICGEKESDHFTKGETMSAKLEAFRAKVEADTVREYTEAHARDAAHGKHYPLSVHAQAMTAKLHIGKKYARIDVGSSGKYMVDMITGNIYGIKAYGVIHRGHCYGNLDTVNSWNWGGYVARQ